MILITSQLNLTITFNHKYVWLFHGYTGIEYYQTIMLWSDHREPWNSEDCNMIQVLLVNGIEINTIPGTDKRCISWWYQCCLQVPPRIVQWDMSCELWEVVQIVAKKNRTESRLQTAQSNKAASQQLRQQRSGHIGALILILVAS